MTSIYNIEILDDAGGVVEQRYYTSLLALVQAEQQIIGVGYSRLSKIFAQQDVHNSLKGELIWRIVKGEAMGTGDVSQKGAR
jgi:hypothetical protein